MENQPLDDRELIEKLKTGDLEALGDLYDRYRSQIHRTALAITHDPAAAEDILQECFLRVYNYASRINSDLPLGPWLYRVTVNLSYTWTKRHHSKTVSIEAFIERLTSPPGQAPETSAERSETKAKIQRAIDSLPFGQKVVIVLYYLNGMNLKEIADILDCPVGTVKSRLFHARENLREQLGADGLFPDPARGFT